MTQSLNQRDRDLLAMPAISSQMPVTFENGAKWYELMGECKGCGHELPDNLVRGMVTRQTPHMVSVEAAGICHECKLVTRFVYRLHDDMKITGPRDGKWLTWGGKRPGFLTKFRAMLGV